MAILQDAGKTNGYLARFLQKMVILQDLARFWQKFLQDDVSSCKILPDSGKILQDNHSDPTWEPFKLDMVFHPNTKISILNERNCRFVQFEFEKNHKLQ